MDLIEINEDNTTRHPWETSRKIIINKFISRIKKSDIEILDVGSGDAYLANSFTSNFKNTYSNCVDIGYTDAQINKIKNNFNNKNLKLHTTLSAVKTNKIDIVTLLDVIEHVPSDIDFLNDIIKQPFISKDTYFIITVPAYQSLFSQHDIALKHYRRYNLKKLKQVITKVNLNYIEGGYFFTTLLITRCFQLIIEKTASKKNKNLDNLGNWKGNRVLTKITKNTLLLDFHVSRLLKKTGLNLPGLSCYIICSSKE
ncbi:methyltransferase domain-containing protein [Mariniflexile sp. AS56]|uniref:methyltransferase domain-containing protein n=1 Tax=Mariniflexile sp. AS56 TaxID=3063957 RepID=UPI0026EAC5BC|nr:methyltransferase domain-containing protein [Mariniflexile sp. AS56]MDO7172751.1 methyltransferase domain-containing protein [Mariniflexile sp. AS56]